MDDVPPPFGLISTGDCGDEERCWRWMGRFDRRLPVILFRQHGDAGASRHRSHAGAWERSKEYNDFGIPSPPNSQNVITFPRDKRAQDNLDI